MEAILPLLSLATTVLASVVGVAVRQALGRVTDGIDRLAKDVSALAAKVNALETERIRNAVTASNLERLEKEIQTLRGELRDLRAEAK